MPEHFVSTPFVFKFHGKCTLSKAWGGCIYWHQRFCVIVTRYCPERYHKARNPYQHPASSYPLQETLLSVPRM